MITKYNLKDLVKSLGFKKNKNKYIYEFAGGYTIAVDFNEEQILYPETGGLIINERQTCNFNHNENFVVFECVFRLLKKGYKPDRIILEPKWQVGHGASGGRADIQVKDNNLNSFLIIECKTWGDEFEKYWKKALLDGGQLFSYARQETSTQYLCMYTSDWAYNKSIYQSNIISLSDNEVFLKSRNNPLTYKDATDKPSLYAAWNLTYDKDYATKGIFEDNISAYDIGKAAYSIDDLYIVGSSDIQKKYHEFATILRQHNVSGRENAFDKLVNLFLAKIVDEIQHPDQLHFYWKGIAFDDYYSLQDRIQRLYKEGMEEFLGEEVTYIDDTTIDDAFRLFKNDPDATKETILKYFRELKFYTNNDFAFLDVHNEKLFYQNAEILLKIVKMLQDIRLKTNEQNQFLGDLFEGFLDQGIKQSEGQFFTPTPIVKFLVSSLPLELMIKSQEKPLKVIDYACGAGHFLNEYATQILDFVPEKELHEYYKNIIGIEKEYRLSKVAKVSAFMYGQDEINIVYGDALSDYNEIEDGTFDVLVANPPYSVKGFLETLSENERNKYDVFSAVGKNGIMTNNSIETFFVERAYQLLSPGGVAAIILPASILSNGKAVYVKAREIVLKFFDVIAIVNFGSGTFGKTGTSTATLFLRKKAENPVLANHYKNRVDAWFGNDFSKDCVFGDRDLLKEYCTHINVDLSIYKTLLASDISNELLNNELFSEYKTVFEKSTHWKSQCKKKTYKKLSHDQQKAEYKREIINFITDIEKDKLYYYLLAASNPQPVVVVKSPSKGTEIKEFLGYDWSDAKGSEGIKYLGLTIDDEDNIIIKNKGINNIKTALFNPNDLMDDKKINSIIRKNYERNNFSVELNTVSSCDLVDMLDFKKCYFDKSISIGVEKKKELNSKFPMERLGDFAEIIPGTSPKSVFYNTDGNGMPFYQGKKDFGHNELLEPTVWTTSIIKKSTRNDILMSVRAPVGDVNYNPYEEICIGRGLAAIRCTDELTRKYLYEVLKYMKPHISGHAGTTFNSISGKEIEELKIPVPPNEVQQQVINECGKIDEEYNNTGLKMEEYRKRLENLFDRFDVISQKHTTLSKLAVFNPSKSILSSLDKNTVVSFVEMASVSNSGYIETAVDRPLSELRKGSYTYFADGDIIIAKITPCMENGKCAIARGLTNAIGMGSSEFHVIRCKEDVSVEFVFGFLNREKVRVEAEKRMTGASGHRRVPISFYENLHIPVIDKKLQGKIVEEYNELVLQMTLAERRLQTLAGQKLYIMEKYLK